MSDRSGLQPKDPRKVLKEFYDAWKGSSDSYKTYIGKDKDKKKIKNKK